MDEVLRELIGELRVRGEGQFEEILKTLSTQAVAYTTTGYEPYNLDPVGKLLLPELTPLQNMGAYAVKAGESGDNFEYRAIVAKNTSKSGGAALNTSSVASVTDTGRAKVIDYTYLKRLKNRQKLAPESAITWELYRASGAFNALGKTTIASLITAKEIEERRILGDCTTALGKPVTPTGTPSNDGGILTNALSPYTVKVIPLNYHGWWYWLADGVAAADITAVTAHGLPGSAVQSEGIASDSSADITIASGTTGSIDVKTTPIKGAFAYLWLMAASDDVFHLADVTTTPFATLTAPTTLVVAAPTVDGSAFDLDGYPLVWDGLYAQTVLDADIPGEFYSLAGNATPGAFTTTGSGCGVLEVERILANIARKYATSPELAIMSPGTKATFANTAIGSSAPAYRFLKQADGDGKIKAGSILTAIFNQYMDTEIPIVSHPLLPDGKILLYTKTIPYPNSGVGVNLELHCTDHFLQDFFAKLTDVAPPGPWAIKTYGGPCLIWPRVCGVVDDIATIIF